MIIGITGPTGAGKSTASKKIAKMGFELISADAVSRKVQAQGTECFNKLIEVFGRGIINSDGFLDRGKLAKIVFKDKKKLQTLSSITHPYILQEIMLQKADFLKNGKTDIIIDAALLFETGLDKECNVTFAVLADKNKRLERIIKRDNLTKQLAQERISSQKDDKYYIDLADRIIFADCDISEFMNKIEKLIVEVCA